MLDLPESLAWVILCGEISTRPLMLQTFIKVTLQALRNLKRSIFNCVLDPLVDLAPRSVTYDLLRFLQLVPKTWTLWITGTALA